MCINSQRLYRMTIGNSILSLNTLRELGFNKSIVKHDQL